MRKAPDLTLPDQAGTARSLADFAGKWVILYFYPKDDTPGCTTEACAFRDDYTLIQEKGIEVIGISGDSVASHANFAQKYRLNFALLADEEGRVIKEYGANGLLGIKRMTFLINPNGEIAKEYEKVTPEGHCAEILADFASLKAKN